MSKRKPRKSKYSIKTILSQAKNYKTRKEFQVKCSGPYRAAIKQGVLEQACAHMIKIKEPKGWWTLQRLLAVAKEYKTMNTVSS